MRAVEGVLASRGAHALLVLADLIGGVADIRAGNTASATARLVSQASRYDSDDRVQLIWVAALEGEVALAQGQYDRATASFKSTQTKVWHTLGRDASTVFATNLPSRDGLARVEIARGNRAAAIEEYRRLTAIGPAQESSAVFEPRYVLELARLLAASGDEAGARVEYGRFLKLWSKADAGLPEIAEAKRALASPRAPGRAGAPIN